MAFKHARGPHAGKWEEEGVIVRETPLAIRLDNGVMTEWLPKRFIRVEDAKFGKVVVFMPDWLAREKRYI